MRTYVVRRTLESVPTLLLITLLVFGLLQVTGGDPIAVMMGPSATAELVQQVRLELALDEAWYVRYASWVGRVMRGDLGRSIRTRLPVTDMILSRLPTTLTLAASAIVFSVVVGLSSGIYAAVRRGRPDSWLVSAGAIAGASVPNYFLALVLMVVLGVRLRWVPVAAFPVDVLRAPGASINLIAPTIALGAAHAALLSRTMRASLLETLGRDHVRTARAKGLGESTVVRQAVRSAALPVVPQIAISAVYLLGGSVLVETIFALPGLGSLLVESIVARDLPVVQGITLVVGLLFVLASLASDLLYPLLDPRIRHG